MAPTLSTGTLLAGGAAALFLSAPASAEDYNWNLRGEDQQGITLQDGDRLNLADGQGTGMPVYGTGENANAATFSAGAITVGSGAELFIHGNNSTITGTGSGGKMTITAGITLQDNSLMIIQDGSYSLSGGDKDYLVVQGAATLRTNWTKYNFIQNLFGEANATLTLESNNVEGRAPAMYILARTTSPSNPHALRSWDGTLVVSTPVNMQSLPTAERVAVVLNGGNILGSNSDIQLNNCGALWLNANSITLPKLTNVDGTTYLRHNAGTNNARQILSNVIINNHLNLVQLTGSQQVSWVFNKLSGGETGTLSWWPWANHYNPSVIYVNNDNSDFEGTVSVAPDYTKSYFGYHPYQRFLQLNSRYALRNATVSLTGMTGASINYSTLALNSSYVSIKELSGGEQGLVYAGTVSMAGTASAPVTDVRPSSSMISELTLGEGTLERDSAMFLGTILEYVHVVKAGANEQTIATLSQDTTRTVSVAEGTLTLGSIGSLRSLVVSPGARANVGLNVDDSGKLWGKWDEQHAYTTAHAISLSDKTRFQGNIVATDEIYGTGMAYLNYSEPGMKVTRFDATGYTGDTITLKMGALSVFDPASVNHVQLDFGSVKRIILESGTGLVAAGPDQTGARDPKINVTQDLEMRGAVYLRAMGTVTRDEETGFYSKVDGYNTIYSGNIYGQSAAIHKSDYGTVTLAGDMSEYGGSIYVDEGRLILSGGVKNLYTLAGGGGNPSSYPANADSSYIDLVNNTSVTAERFQLGDHSNDWSTVEKGSVLNITSVENEKAYANNDSGLSAYCSDSTFLIGSKNGRTELTIDGTVNMLNCGYISTGSRSRIGGNADGAIYASHSVTVRAGGVLNMKGLALQVWEDMTKTDLIIQSGGTLNLGEAGLASWDVTTGGNNKGEGYDSLRLTFESGSTLGILDSAASWSSTRAIKSDGLTVNTQGYIPNLGGSGQASYGSATGLGRTINLGHFQGSLTKTGLGLLRVAANSVFDRLTVNQGFFAVTADANYVLGGVKNLTTTGNGSLLFTLTETINWSTPGGGSNQETIKILSDVNGTLNITVRPDTGGQAQGEYRILDGLVPEANQVHLTALVGDGWVAKYETVTGNTNAPWGVVKITYKDQALVGIKDELNWQIGGETNVWANSTDKNWMATDNTSAQRFVNGNATDGYSSVVFEGNGTTTSEEVTILDSVLVNNMTVKSRGWEFLGEGGITGAGALTIESGASATFANTLANHFETIDIQEGGTLRLGFLDSKCANWDDVTFGGSGTLEIATGANHALASNNGLRFGNLAELKLTNNTSFDVQTTNTAVAESLANPHRITIDAGSHLGLNANSLRGNNTSGRELHLAGAGSKTASSNALASALGIAYHKNYVDGAVQNYTITNHVYLDDDATVYVAAKADGTAHNGYLTGDYHAQGHILTKTGEGLLGIGNTTASAGSGSEYSGGFNIQEGTLLLNLLAAGEPLSDTKKIVGGPVTISREARLSKAGGHIEIQGGLFINGSASITSSTGTGLTVNSVVSGDSDSVVYLTPTLGTNAHDTLVLTADNTRKETADGGTGFAGTWDVSNWTLRAEHTNALVNASVTLYDSSAVLELGNAADHYVVRGLDGPLEAAVVRVVEGGAPKTLEIRSDELHTYYGGFGPGVSLIMNGRGGQSILHHQLYDTGFNGDITVTAGMLEVFSLNGLMETNITVADAGARLNHSMEPLNLGSVKSFTANRNGAVLDGNLNLTSGGKLLLGANGKVWDKGNTGLDLNHHRLTLNTGNKVELDLSLSAFLEAGDTVTLFSNVDSLTIDGQNITYLDQLKTLGDYFNISSDINLPGAKIVYTSDHQLQIILNKDSNGLYWEWKGGDGEWNLVGTNHAWSPKDNHEASTGFRDGYAAYFTDENGTADISVTDTISVSEMAVRNGIYNFTIGAGESLTIENSLYEKEGGQAHFFLNNGSTLSIGSESELANSTVQTVNGQVDVATLAVGQKLTLSDGASIKDVNLQLAALAGSAAGATLDLTDTTGSSVAALNGYGKVTAQGGALRISNTRDGNFTGEFAGTVGTTPDGGTLYNVLTIEEGDGKQTFDQVKTNDSWQITNNGDMVFKPADGSSLNSLTLGAGSNTSLTLNTDAAHNGLNLATLTVDKNIEGLTINSTGKRALTREQFTLLEATEGLSMEEGTPLTVNIGNGVFFKRVDKSKGATVTKDGNKLVLNVQFTDRNTYADFVSDPNASAGAGMLWDIDSGSLSTDSDLARLDAYTYGTVESGNKTEAERIMAAAAGASTAVLGAAFSSDVERQLKAIRNRTTTMGVNQCAVNENMPYYNAWINAEGNFRDLSSDGLQSGYSLNSWGGTVGFDADVNPYLTLGLALTGMYGDLETDGVDKAEGDFDTVYLSAFARVAHRAWVHTVVATVGRADVTLDRTVAFGNDSYTAHGSTDGTAFGLMYEAGRTIAMNEDASVCLQPVFNVIFRHSSISGYEEEQTDAALKVGDQDFTTLTFGAGARMQAVVGENLYNRTSIFEARALLKVDAGDRQGESDVALLHSAGQSTYTIEAAEMGAVGIELGAGMTIPVGADNGSIFFDASCELRSGYTDINGTVGYRVNF